MTPERLRAVTASCLVTVTLAFCFFVYLKNRNDSRIARDTTRIADAAEISTAMAIEREIKRFPATQHPHTL